LGKFNDFIHIIFFGDFILPLVPAFQTALGQNIFSFFQLDVNRFHQSATGGGAVAGIDINVLAPKTIRAMVGVPIAFNFRPAILTGEVFNFPLEFFHKKEESPMLSGFFF
jgi:hypothetical protein